MVGALDKDIIRRIVRAHINEVRYCYNQELARNPNADGRVAIQFTIGPTGKVPTAVVAEHNMGASQTPACIAKAVRRWTFPKPEGGGSVIVTYPFVLGDGKGVGPVVQQPPPPPPTPEELARRAAEEAAQAARLREMEARARIEQAEWEAAEKIRQAERDAETAEMNRTAGSPYTGKFFDVAQLIKDKRPLDAVAKALAWHEQEPGDVLALIALGEAAEAAGDALTAARAYGSIIDLFPSRADLRRYAGARLEGLGEAGLSLAVDTYEKAVKSRPDHPSSHRLPAYALVKAGRHKEAFQAIQAGTEQSYPCGGFRGVDQILRGEMGLTAAAWLKAE